MKKLLFLLSMLFMSGLFQASQGGVVSGRKISDDEYWRKNMPEGLYEALAKQNFPERHSDNYVKDFEVIPDLYREPVQYLTENRGYEVGAVMAVMVACKANDSRGFEKEFKAWEDRIFPKKNQTADVKTVAKKEVDGEELSRLVRLALRVA